MCTLCKGQGSVPNHPFMMLCRRHAVVVLQGRTYIVDKVAGKRQMFEGPSDRKSTRLNSSH